jgi:uncharacterized protein
MAEIWLRYDRMVEDALRSVVRKSLIEAAQRGLPGEHHFYITFHTERPGVGIADWLRQQYPQEMTIILQHQFWDLTVSEDRFEVGLSFGGIPERLVVPFNSIKSFFDPSAQFGLQFEASDAAPETPTAKLPAVPVPAPVPAPQAVAEKASEPRDEPAKPSDGAEVVRLDRFRKK